MQHLQHTHTHQPTRAALYTVFLCRPTVWEPVLCLPVGGKTAALPPHVGVIFAPTSPPPQTRRQGGGATAAHGRSGTLRCLQLTCL